MAEERKIRPGREAGEKEEKGSSQRSQSGCKRERVIGEGSQGLLLVTEEKCQASLC